MSRYYAMSVRIKDFNLNRTTEIKHAASNEWQFDDDRWEESDNFETYLECETEGHLYGGETEEGFVDRLSAAIWKANQGFCTVEVTATFMESLPCQEHFRNERDYARLMQNDDLCERRLGEVKTR